MTSKKVLIVTYYWPPAGGPGVQRWLKFVKYLPEFGIEPIVYCPKNPNYPIIDETLLNEIPKEITILKQSIKEPYGFAKWFSKGHTKTMSSGILPKKNKQTWLQKFFIYVRGNFFIPDARKFWIKPSVRFLSNYIEKHQISTVITTGPPHSLHLIGLHLKERLTISWYADFRDPWTTIGYHKALKLSESSQKKHLQLEHSVLNTANHIIVTSNHTKKEFLQKTAQPISVITNGYDISNSESVTKDSVFSITHVGSLLSDRNPLMLWEVLSELVKENKAFAEKFQLNLVGVVSEEIIEAITAFALQPYLNSIGYVSHKEAQVYQNKSQLLLLIEIDSEDTKAIIPGKLFEYLVSGTPIFAIGPKDSDVEQIIQETQTGYYFNYSNKEAMKNCLLSCFELYKKNSLKVDAKNVERHSRHYLSSKLAKLLSD